MAHQSSDKNERGTLLLVGEHGELKRVKPKKGVVAFLLFALFVSMAISGGLYVLHQRAERENAVRTEQLRGMRERILSLRNEKERLIARLVLMESSREEAAGHSEGDVEEAAGAKEAELPYADAPPESGESGGGAPDGRTRPGEVAASAVKKPSPRVDADNFKIAWDKKNSSLRVQLKVVNVAPASGSIAGYTLAALKPKKPDRGRRLLFPGGTWTTRRAFDHLKGYLFSISNYKVIRFKPKKMAKREWFESVEVFIHAENGSLMLQKEFTIPSAENGGQ